MTSSVIIIGGIGQSKATGIYRERNGKLTLSMQNLPLGNYTVCLFFSEHGRRTVGCELPFDGRYLSTDRALSAPAGSAAIVERGKIVAYGTNEGILPSAAELEALLEQRKNTEGSERRPTEPLRDEPRFFREDDPPKTVSFPSEEAYAGISPEDFLLQTITDPLMKEDLTALEAECLLSQANAEHSAAKQSANAETTAEIPSEDLSPESVKTSGNAYTRERSERVSEDTASVYKSDFDNGDGRTVILQGNRVNFRNESEPTYYETIRQEVERLLDGYEHEDFLESFIEESSFVRIPFDDIGHYYIFGIVNEDGKPKYLCFAVPEPYRNTPPESLKGFTRFVPRDPLHPYGDGYFMMFQSAVSGRTIPVRD